MQWFVLRVSYGRTVLASKLLEEESIKYYLPFRRVVRLVKNKRRKVLEPLLPNIIFAYTSEKNIRAVLKERQKPSYLSIYYNHFERNKFGLNPPLTIDPESMQQFINLTSVDNEHIRVVDYEACHFKTGLKVKIVDGKFAGVEGKVARVAGQQRVVVELEGLCFIATAYIPTAFIQPLVKD